MTAVVETAELAERLRPVVTDLTLLLRREAALPELSQSQLTVLGALARHGPARITTLAADAHVRQPSMTTLVNRLQRAGCVRRVPDADDQRAVRVALTPQGRALVDRAIAARTATLAGRLDRLRASDRAAIAAAIPALTRLISEDTD